MKNSLLIPNEQDFVLGNLNCNPYHIINFVVIFAKQYIYKNKCLGKVPALDVFQTELETIQKVELYKVKYNCKKLRNHVKKWSPIYPELKRLYLE